MSLAKSWPLAKNSNARFGSPTARPVWTIRKPSLPQVIISTIVSYLLDMNGDYNVPVVGNIPTGLPLPTAPRWDILPSCISASIGITIVALAIHLSMAKMLAAQAGYQVDSRQELYAMGTASMGAGLFSVYPVSTAIAQTMLNVSCGVKTQLSALFSCLLMVVVICWLGPLLNALPMCILASIMIVAMKRLFHRKDELLNLWLVSKADLLVWVVAFLSTVIINVMEGLAISIVVALLTIVFRTQWPKCERTIGFTPLESSDDKPSKPEEDLSPMIPNVAVFSFDAPLLFTNSERFAAKARKAAAECEKLMEDRSDMAATESRFIIFDCASTPYMDAMGVKVFRSVFDELNVRGFTVCMAAAKTEVVRVLRHQGVLEETGKVQVFSTVQDALFFVESTIVEHESV